MFFFLDLPLNLSVSDRILQVPAQSTISVPLTHTGVQMCLRPINLNNLFQYCTETIDWTVVKKPLEVIENRITCRANHNNIFKYVINKLIIIIIIKENFRIISLKKIYIICNIFKKMLSFL